MTGQNDMNNYSYDELKAAISEMKKSSSGVVNTCYYFPADLKKKIEEAAITYDIQKDHIVMFEENRDFYNMMFCISDKTGKIFADKDKKITTDIVYSSTRPVAESTKKVLENSDFSLFAKAFFMTKTDFLDTDSMEIKNDITFANEDMAENIIALWREVLDPAKVNIENRDELIEKIRKKQVIVFRDEKNEITASMTADLDAGENAMIRHVAVSDKARGRGLGMDLLVFYLKERETIGFKRASLWVEDFRQAAIGLYTKAGFKNGGREMLRYIKN